MSATRGGRRGIVVPLVGLVLCALLAGGGAPAMALLGESLATPAVAKDVVSAVSTEQYTLRSSDGGTWQPVDPARLSLVVERTVPVQAVITANADLWTWTPGINQDLGVFVDGSLAAWKESGGFAGAFSPNAVTVNLTVPLAAGQHTIDLRWKANKPDPSSTIAIGAGPSGKFSPTRLLALLIPLGDTTTVASATSTDQQTLAGSDGATWEKVDPIDLAIDVNPALPVTAVLTANADLWTWAAGLNQDLAIFVDGTLAAWKESGGFAGTFSPNAALVTHSMQLSPGPHTIDLRWKTNKPTPAVGESRISAGAGPIGGSFSPTTLTALLLPASDTTSVASVASTEQYTRQGGDGPPWDQMDPSRLSMTVHPTTDVNAVITGSADLWTWKAGNNQDLAVFVDGALRSWKESGGFAGTFSPNAAAVTVVVPLDAGPHTIDLRWKPNTPDAAAQISAGAGPIAGSFSPTRLTAMLLPDLGPSWRAEALPAGGTKPVPAAVVNGISCPTGPDACVAVGHYADADGGHPFVQTLSGGTWTSTPLPSPADAKWAVLVDVSCPTDTTACVAVGYYGTSTGMYALAVELADGVWTPSTPGTPTASTHASLGGVSCPTSTADCVAVGQFWGADGQHPLLERLVGDVWTPSALAAPAGTTEAVLGDVTCPAATTACIAVGIYVTPDQFTDSGPRRPMVQTLSGGTWTMQTPAEPPGSHGIHLSGVSCRSAITSCVAVGSYSGTAGARGLFQTLDGGIWTPRLVEGPAGTVEAVLRGVSCSSADDTCVAVGRSRATSQSQSQALVGTLSNGMWAPATPPLPAGTTTSFLGGVSCPTSTAACVAAGSAGIGTTTVPVIETLSGAAWTLTTPPPPELATDDLAASSCAAPGQCVAVGKYLDAAGQSHPLVATMAEGTWTPLIPAVPPGTIEAELRGVSCSSPTVCVAVGRYIDASGQHPLVVTLAGTTWTPSTPTVPADSLSARLNGVSCPVATDCVAVGQYASSSGTRPLVEILSGGTSTPVSTGLAHAWLTGVSCPTTSTACVAVGTHVSNWSDLEGLAGTLVAGTWTPIPPPAPPRYTTEILTGVSCPTTVTDCVAIGSRDHSTGTHAVVQTLAGTAWASDPTPQPTDVILKGVSCPASTTACVAVGQHTGDVADAAVVSVLAGGSWRQVGLGAPTAATGANLQGVSCLGGTSVCAAVGAVSNTRGDVFALAATTSAT